MKSRTRKREDLNEEAQYERANDTRSLTLRVSLQHMSSVTKAVILPSSLIQGSHYCTARPMIRVLILKRTKVELSARVLGLGYLPYETYLPYLSDVTSRASANLHHKIGP